MKLISGSVLVAILVFSFIFWGCAGDDQEDFVARVGDRYLSQSALQEAISTLPKGMDGEEAKKQVIENWISSALLAQEAQSKNLAEDPAVKTQIEESTRSVLIGALLDKVNAETLPEPTATEIATYFQQHMANLPLREDYVRIWYIRSQDQNKAITARNEMLSALKSDGKSAEKLWSNIASKYADDKDAALTLSYSYLPESRFEDTNEDISDVISALKNQEVSDVENIGGLWHVIALIDRAKAGSTPKLSWIQDEIRQQLRIRAKKLRYATFLQELKSKAMAKNSLEIKGAK